MGKLLFAMSILICLTTVGCNSPAKSHAEVELVDRSAVFAPGIQSNPLILVIDISDGGKLSLNKIETGTISDPVELSEKLKAIFDDRKRTGIDKAEVVIDAHGEVDREDFDRLIHGLADVNASPIRVIRNEY